MSGFISFAIILRRRLTRSCSCFVETAPIIVIVDDDDDPQAPDDDDIAVTPPVPVDVIGEVTPDNDFQFTTRVTASPSCGTETDLSSTRFDICLLQDASGSFSGSNAANLVAADEEIFSSVNERVLSARYGVSAYIDHPPPGNGGAGDYPYRLFSSMSDTLEDWVGGIEGIQYGSGFDLAESGYDGIVGAAQGFNDEPDCGWSDDITVQRVLVVATDARFHTPLTGRGGVYINDEASTTAILISERIKVIGLEARGASFELDNLAAATGGVVQPLSSDGRDIADAIIGGITLIECTISPIATGCDPLTVTFSPSNAVVEPGGSADFITTFSWDGEPTSAVGTTVICNIEFVANGDVVESLTVSIDITEDASSSSSTFRASE